MVETPLPYLQTDAAVPARLEPELKTCQVRRDNRAGCSNLTGLLVHGGRQADQPALLFTLHGG